MSRQQNLQTRLCPICNETRRVQIGHGRSTAPAPCPTCRKGREPRTILWELTRWPMLDGACSNWPDPNLWFRPGDETKAARICAGCPVQDACLKFALDNDIPHGVWGGVDPDRRHQLRAAS